MGGGDLLPSKTEGTVGERLGAGEGEAPPNSCDIGTCSLEFSGLVIL